MTTAPDAAPGPATGPAGTATPSPSARLRVPVPDESSPVVVSAAGGVLEVRLNRPRQRNALTREMAVLIAAAMDRLDEDDDLTVGILSGTGSSFCAGMDLKGFAAGEIPTVPGRGFGGLVASPPAKPLIAAVTGHAVAGGMELVLACDLVVADEDARFGLPEVTRGLIASGGGLLRLAERVPPAVAMDIALTGRVIPATEAHRYGLVSRIAETGTALAVARELAGTIAANAPLAVAGSKKILTESREWLRDEKFDRQRKVGDAIAASDDAREGARAFAEKRTPHWSGR